MMNPHANLKFARRLPHEGKTIHGPYEDKSTKVAERIIISIVVIFSILFAVGKL